MQLKFLPSFVKRKGRITKKQTQSLSSLSEFSVKSIQEVEDFSKHFDKCYLEIGFGNAENIIFQAINNPSYLFIGSEVYMSGIGTLVSSIKENNINNIKIFSDDIRLLLDQSPKKVFDSVIIICPDPWPKEKHHKRRLINKSFLDKEDMNEINFSKKITQKRYSDNDFVYNFLSSLRKKINDPLGQKSITTD